MDAYRSACQGVKNVSNVAAMCPCAHESRCAPATTPAESPTMIQEKRAGAVRATSGRRLTGDSRAEVLEIIATNGRVCDGGCRHSRVGKSAAPAIDHAPPRGGGRDRSTKLARRLPTRTPEPR